MITTAGNPDRLACAATRGPRDRELAPNTKACGMWRLHIGTVQIFILGDAPNAWLAASEPEYRTGQRIGTIRERNIAKRAIRILRETQNHNPEAGPAEIRAALAQAAMSYPPVTVSH